MKPEALWTRERVEVFLRATTGTRLEVAWNLLAVGGLRVGEALALSWSDVEWTTGEIRVGFAVFGTRYAELAVPADAPRERTVDAGQLLDVLAAHRRRQTAVKSEWGDEYCHDDLVVCQVDGRPLHPRDLNTAFIRIVSELGLPVIRLAELRRARATVEVVGP